MCQYCENKYCEDPYCLYYPRRLGYNQFIKCFYPSLLKEFGLDHFFAKSNPERNDISKIYLNYVDGEIPEEQYFYY
ncbi:MAG: hypothetical protein BV457_07205 [Thermoplasmata archaeon M9B1D]|nr:MAG: hypothetical protein BV457_07205 [Thermoplasmata archaeon M9B1D]